MAELALIALSALAESMVAKGEGEYGVVHWRLNHFAAVTLEVLIFGPGSPLVVATAVNPAPAAVIICNGFVCKLLPRLPFFATVRLPRVHGAFTVARKALEAQLAGGTAATLTTEAAAAVTDSGAFLNQAKSQCILHTNALRMI